MPTLVGICNPDAIIKDFKSKARTQSNFFKIETEVVIFNILL